MKQLVLDIGLVPEPTLDGLVPGRNAQALQQLRDWLQAPGGGVPLYLWGAPGSGKSHVLRAARQALVERGFQVGWLDAASSPHADFDENWQAIVLDETHAYDAALQHTAFSWFVQALAPGQGAACAVLAAGQMPPADLPLREDLRTRLGWGLVFELQPLSDAEGRAALQAAARARGLQLPDEVMDYVWTRFSRNLGHLMRLLERLDRYALQTRRGITVPLIRAMLEDEQGEAD